MLNGSQTNVQNSSIAARLREDAGGEKETQRAHVFLNGKREADDESCANRQGVGV